MYFQNRTKSMDLHLAIQNHSCRKHGGLCTHRYAVGEPGILTQRIILSREEMHNPLSA